MVLKMASSAQPVHPMSSLANKTQLCLDEKEEILCQWLRGTVQRIAESPTATTRNVQVRFAGGWVRDKILGINSYDIDVAISSMTGAEFATYFKSYLDENQEEYLRTFGISQGKVDLAQIASNPDQSKHLDTVRVTLGRERSPKRSVSAKDANRIIELDFVNLRSEHYVENSRIPTQMAFGTPLEDAYRRDLTINALFYNVHASSIEDLTNQGLQDLEDRIIRTPLAPRETFKDDPLRLLRAVRFAARLGFQMVDAIFEAVEDVTVLQQLDTKVSKERVGIEVEKMLCDKHAQRALMLLGELKLWPIVFGHDLVEADFRKSPSARCASNLQAELFPLPQKAMTTQNNFGGSTMDFTFTRNTQKNLWLAAAMLPHRGKLNPTGKRGETLVASMLRQKLKLNNKDNVIIDHLVLALDLLTPSNVTLLLEQSRDETEFRKVLGRLLREKPFLDQWRPAFAFAKAYHAEDSTIFATQLEELTALVYHHHLEDVHQLRPIVDGKRIMKILDSKPGKALAYILEQVIDWQLMNPSGSAEMCEQWLSENRVQILRSAEDNGV